MKLYNICYTCHPQLFNALIKNTEKDNNGIHFQSSSDEQTNVYIFGMQELEAFLSLHSVDEILRVIYVGVGKLHISSHLSPGDILFPNTFLSKNTSEALYLDYAVGEAFDLEKFVLHLDGVCSDAFGDVSEEYDGDIEESEVYNFLAHSNEIGLSDKNVVILGTEDSPEHFERVSAIVDMVCSD